MTPPRAAAGRPVGRAAFLGLLAAGVSAIWWARPAADVVGAVLGRSPAGGWRIYSVAGELPTFDPGSWTLRIDGLVERPLDLSFADILALPAAEQVSDFHCVSGWSVRGVVWKGVRFAHLLELARPLTAAAAMRFVSTERPYEDSLTLEQALVPDAMLAYELDGEPLSRAHGAPVRVVMPQMFGYKSVKWVERVELTGEPVVGYWEGIGWHPDPWVDGRPVRPWHASF